MNILKIIHSQQFRYFALYKHFASLRFVGQPTDKRYDKKNKNCNI